MLEKAELYRPNASIEVLVNGLVVQRYWGEPDPSRCEEVEVVHENGSRLIANVKDLRSLRLLRECGYTHYVFQPGQLIELPESERTHNGDKNGPKMDQDLRSL